MPLVKQYLNFSIKNLKPNNEKSNYIFFAILISFAGIAQTYDSPESIEFDYANNRWLIANTFGNNILARSSSTGILSVLIPSVSNPYGIEIVNDTLYVCSGAV